MSDARSKLSEKAEAVRRQDAFLWGEFLTSLVAYADEARDRCVFAPVATMQVAQGQAQGLAALIDVLTRRPQK